MLSVRTNRLAPLRMGGQPLCSGLDPTDRSVSGTEILTTQRLSTRRYKCVRWKLVAVIPADFVDAKADVNAKAGDGSTSLQANGLYRVSSLRSGFSAISVCRLELLADHRTIQLASFAGALSLILLVLVGLNGDSAAKVNS